MNVCEFCGREFRTKRGLKIHVTRTHKTHNKLNQASMKLTFEFFKFLEKRKWQAAERSREKIGKMDPDSDWLRGYVQALMGMIVSIRNKTSHVQPFILKVREYERDRLQEEEKFFEDAAKNRINTEFERGFFQCWNHYIKYLVQKIKE